jgi:hypothetical protein
MKIKNVEWRNFFSYGNKKQVLDFPNQSSLIQLSGKNGQGKCFSGDTVLKISVTEETLKKIRNQ